MSQVIEEKDIENLRTILNLRKDLPRNITTSKIKEITEWNKQKIHEKNHPVLNAEKVFGQNIHGEIELKRIVALQTLSSNDPFHVMFLGDPACAKSEITQSVLYLDMENLNQDYIWGTKLTKAGLTLSRGDKGVLSVGALPRSHFGHLAIDEFDKMSSEESGALFSSLQHGFFSIEQARLKAFNIPSQMPITALANPKLDYWISNQPNMIKNQIPFNSLALLTRFHLLYIVIRPDVKEARKIAEHQVKSEIEQTPKINMNKIDKEYWINYVLIARRIKIKKWSEPEKAKKIISIFYTKAYEQFVKYDNMAIPISPRINEGLEKIAKCYAKTRLDDTVRLTDVVQSVKLMAKALSKSGLNTNRIYNAIIKEVNSVKQVLLKTNGDD